MIEIKEVNKRLFRIMCYGIIAIGLIGNAIFYTILVKTLEVGELQYMGFLALSCIIIGAGIGLACSRMFLIKDFERRV